MTERVTKKFNPRWICYFICFALCFVNSLAVAAQFDPQGLGGVASNMVVNFAALARLVTAGSYIAGMGFAVSAILKFKAHKESPTQIPIGTPIALVFIAAALIFLPSISNMAGHTLFGGHGQVGGASGVVSFGH